MLKIRRILSDFLVGFLAYSLSWACWAARTAACVDGRAWSVAVLAGCEEALMIGVVVLVAKSTHWLATGFGCVLGAAVGAGVATWLGGVR